MKNYSENAFVKQLYRRQVLIFDYHFDMLNAF